MSATNHARHHLRFYSALLIGAATWLAASQVSPRLALMAAGDTFFAVYLLMMSVFFRGATTGDLRRRADYEDEGAAIIFVLTGLAIVFCFVSIFTLLGGKPGLVHLLVSLVSVPLGWLTLHTMLALHYARLHYARDASSARPGQRRRDRGGLVFPGTAEPSAWDFLYFSYVIGMTAQVSDVQVEDGGTRRLVLVHSVVSFFINTVLVALAVNVAINVSQ
ncbi:MAG: rane protein [Hydrocarboniphaga sp.]|uniref:DUF1345 domain-containing protein n=1 Tax=Hydrocarboniphaga sp. TaxID=2033016 RepID=UPI0026136796|nr:DUF1345 domain-containing protein [Hydrocarboniphaga sp.]MDB5971284.1 rane protein [Hydrocarboniphaga sp.]